MDLFPPLSTQILWMAVLSFLSYFSLKIIRSKNLLSVCLKPFYFIKIQSVLITFGFYITLSLVIVPIGLGLFGIPIKNPITTLSLFNLLFMTLVAGFLICYLKIAKIDLIHRFKSPWAALFKTALYLIVFIPLVCLIAQICDTTLYLLFDVKGYEQQAVAFLKSTKHYPLALLGSLVSIVIFAPLIEEILFRGILFNFFQTRLGSWPAISLSGLIFALFHFSLSQGWGNVSLLVALTFLGMVLAVFYLMTKNLLYPILFHAIFNFLSSLRILFFEA